jgi:hypothetical protein
MKTYKIRNPSNLRLVVGMVLLLLIHIAAVAINGTLHFAGIISGTFCVFVLIVVWIRRARGPRLLGLDHGAIWIGNRKLEAKNILMIYMDQSQIGIKPKKSKIVPISLCFEYCNKSESDSLMKWANDNGIEVLQRKFTRWI